MFDPSWKPLLSALIQPPGSLLLLIVAGVWLMRHRAGAGRLLAGLGVIGLWLMGCSGTAVWLQDAVLRPPPALGPVQIRQLMRNAPGQPPTAIVVLGAGRQADSAEYGGAAHLTPQAMARLHYGVWLARHTGQPLAYSGGVGWAQSGEASEAAAAARIVQDDYGTTLRWSESRSRDTRENADLTVSMLDSAGVRRIVLVTHAAHMPRAVRAFREAAGNRITIVPAPLAFATAEHTPMDWVPTEHGLRYVHAELHELIGLVTGS